MLTYHLSTPTTGGKMYCEGECLSTDEKPTDVANGSKMMEMDTSTLYTFDEANRVWRAW